MPSILSVDDFVQLGTSLWDGALGFAGEATEPDRECRIYQLRVASPNASLPLHTQTAEASQVPSCRVREKLTAYSHPLVCDCMLAG